jgi:ribose transport system permease protein
MLYLAVVLFGILYPTSFLSIDNIKSILNNNVSVEGMMAIGMMILLIGGVFDLSIGSMFSLTGALAGFFMMSWGCHPIFAVPMALACSALGGLVNGLLVSKIKVNAMITTLGTLGIFKGLAVLIAGPNINGLPKSFTWIGQTSLLDLGGRGAGIQLPFWLMLVLAAIAHYLMKSTRFFRQDYYVGSNEKAAKLSGIRVEWVQCLGFVGMAMIAGLAGILFAARVGSASSTAGDQMELKVITAVVLGGASLQGGKGSVLGAVLGVLFIAIVWNMVFISRVPSYWQSIVVGCILIAAVASDSLQNKQTR